MTREATRVIKTAEAPYFVLSGAPAASASSGSSRPVIMQRVECLYPESAKPVNAIKKEDLNTVDSEGQKVNKEDLISGELADLANDIFQLTEEVATELQVLNANAGNAATSDATASGGGDQNAEVQAVERNHQPLRHIHFAVSKNSEAFKVLSQGYRRHALFYQSTRREAYTTLNGTVAIVEDSDLRRRYWSARFLPCLSPTTLVQNAQAAANKGEGAEAPKPWESSDYVLLRFMPDELELRSCTASEQFASRKLHLNTETRRWDIA